MRAHGDIVKTVIALHERSAATLTRAETDHTQDLPPEQASAFWFLLASSAMALAIELAPRRAYTIATARRFLDEIEAAGDRANAARPSETEH